VLTYRCSRCATPFSLLDWRNTQWSSSRRVCSSCGAVLEMSNAPLMLVLDSLIGGVLAITTYVALLGSAWLTFSVLAPVALLQMLAILHFGTCWAVTAKSGPTGAVPPDQPLARRWSRLRWLGVLTGLAFVVVSAGMIYGQYQTGVDALSPDPEVSAAAGRRYFCLQERLPFAVVLALCAFAFGAYAYSRRIRILRAAYRKLMSTDHDAQWEAGPVRRRTCGLRQAVHLLLLFVVPQTCVWVALDAITRDQVERKLQAIRDAGDPVTYREPPPRLPPVGQNAAVLYQQVIRADFSRPYNRENHSLFEATGQSRLIEREFGRDGSRADEARAVLNDPAVSGAFKTLEQASALPHCVFPVHWAFRGRMLGHVRGMHQASAWLAAKARLCTMEGAPDEALRWIDVIFGMAEHVAQEATANAQSSANSLQAYGLRELERTLSETTPSAGALQRLTDHLQRMNVAGWADQALRGQRATTIDRFAQLRQPNLEEDWVARSGHDSAMLLLYSYRFAVFRPFYNADLNRYLEDHEEVVTRSATVPARSAPPRPPSRQHPFGFDLELMRAAERWGTGDSIARERDDAIMDSRLGRVALALTLHKIAHGEYPAMLYELRDEIEWELLWDVFAGAPLKYERRPDGFILYSFGPNRKDDGGVSKYAPRESPRDYDLVWECPVPPPPPL